MQHRSIHGIHFIRVQGSVEERARAHATLLRDQILEGAIPALMKKNEWLIRRSPLLRDHPWLQSWVVAFYKKVIIPILDANTPKELKSSLHIASGITGIPYSQLREVLFQADALMILVRASLTRTVLPDWIPGGFPGCTSGVARKEWTRDGRLLACRNFDYLIVGPWEKHQTIVFNEPTEPGSIPFVSLTSAGVQSGGVTSMNQEGMTLFAHAHFGKKISFTGQTVVAIGEDVISHAKTIGQAVDIVRKRRSCANWAFVISSGKENTAVVTEVTPAGVRVREMQGDVLAHSNYFHNPELRKSEALFCGAYCEDLHARYGKMKETLESYPQRLAPEHLTALLGDQRDYFTNQERIVGNTVGVVTTIQSAVFEPESQKFWVACRDRSPVGLGEFLEVDVANFWKNPDSAFQSHPNAKEEISIETSQLGGAAAPLSLSSLPMVAEQVLPESQNAFPSKFLPGYRPENPELIEAFVHYRKAYQAYQMENHFPDYRERTLKHLQDALKSFPSDGHLWMQVGLFSFQMKLFDQAKIHFEEAAKRPLSAHIDQVRSLYLARCLDLEGKREQALPLYATFHQAAEPKLRKALKKGLRRPYREKNVKNILLDLQYSDSFEYS